VRVVLQRVRHAKVTVDGQVVGEIGRGLLLLVAFADGDNDATLAWMAQKCADLRIFPDDAGKMNRSLLDVGGDVLAVSQFTLYGDCRKGRRPSFIGSAPPQRAEALYDRFLAELPRIVPGQVASGRFGAEMKVELLNDGPVTLILDRDGEAA